MPVREMLKMVAVVAAIYAAIVVGAVVAFFVGGFLFLTWVDLKVDVERLEIPRPPITFSQYKRHGHYIGYWYNRSEEMEYNEYYYWYVTFANRPGYQPVAQENMSEILGFVQDYEQRVDDVRGGVREDVDRLCRRYRYDVDSLTPGDYYRVDVQNEEQPFDDYKLYVFDHETNTLYYLCYRKI